MIAYKTGNPIHSSDFSILQFLYGMVNYRFQENVYTFKQRQHEISHFFQYFLLKWEPLKHSGMHNTGLEGHWTQNQLVYLIIFPFLQHTLHCLVGWGWNRIMKAQSEKNNNNSHEYNIRKWLRCKFQKTTLTIVHRKHLNTIVCFQGECQSTSGKQHTDLWAIVRGPYSTIRMYIYTFFITSFCCVPCFSQDAMDLQAGESPSWLFRSGYQQTEIIHFFK